ncbi:hypothetical protein AOLI_G00241610 [Acnodon oligacanthus]
MLRKQKEFQLSNPDINKLRILLHGPIGAEMSSFINSVNTVLQGCNTTAALADSAARVESHSFTVKLLNQPKSGIPQVTIMIMVDEICPLVKDDLEKIYTSKKIKEKMQECCDSLRIPLNCIYPVKNYSEEVTNDLHLDVLILVAMKDIIMFANDYVEDQNYTEQGPKMCSQ